MSESERELPSLPSALIRVACEDLEACVDDPRYIVDMGSWHLPDVSDETLEPACRVCLAGAVMAKSLGAEPEFKKLPAMYDEPLGTQLDALDDLRSGAVLGGLRTLGVPKEIATVLHRAHGWVDGNILTTHDPDGVLERMGSLADDLEKRGF